MAKIILASHGGLSAGMLDSVKMIVGELAADVETYSLLPGRNPNEYVTELKERISTSSEEFIIVCDIKGGSVYNALIQLLDMDNVEIISGMNMNIVLELVIKNSSGCIDIDNALKEGKEGIQLKNKDNVVVNTEDEDFYKKEGGFMLVGLRVDHRLLHGQVAFSWTSALGADCILIANTAVTNDNLRKTAIKMAKPAGTKLVIKNIEDSIKALNSGVTDKYKLFVIVESVKDAYELMTKADIHSVTLGGTKATDETKNISKAVNLTDEEISLVKELIERGDEVEIRMVPADKKMLAKNVL